MTSRPKRPRDTNQLAKRIVDIATGEVEDNPSVKNKDKNQAAVELGRFGGLKGGKARAKNLSTKRRSEIARRAAVARWGTKTLRLRFRSLCRVRLVYLLRSGILFRLRYLF